MPRKSREPEPEIEDLVVADGGSEHHAHSVSAHDADLKRVKDVRESLLVWYDVHRRKLPWRGDVPPFLSTATHRKQPNTAKRKQPATSLMDSFVVRSSAVDSLNVKAEPPNAEPSSLNGDAEPPRKVAPYETWVSEIMLQQTRVDTVVDYFLRWIDKFPTVEALADASEEDVNAMWAGLGYYRRARMLHAGAKYVVENCNGQLPSSTEQLLKIPGIGPYTAGAISSIAFGNQEPLVDGNVIRVIARLRAVGADPKNKKLINFAWQSARELVDGCDRPGSLNQSLMELGATVCTVQNPLCTSCPVRASCLAYEESITRVDKPPAFSSTHSGESACDLCDPSRVNEWLGQPNKYEVTRYPLKAKKNESKNEAICVAVISHDTVTSGHKGDNLGDGTHESWKFLMVKRPEGGLLAGQWQFIHSKVDDSDQIPSFSHRQTHLKPRFKELFGASTSSLLSASNKSLRRRDRGELVHIFSHVKHHMGIEHLHFNKQPPVLGCASGEEAKMEMDAKDNSPLSAVAMRWMTREDMNQLGITTGVKKILDLVLKGETTGTTGTAPKKTLVKKRASSKSVVEDGNVVETSTATTKKVHRREAVAASPHVADAVPVSTAKRMKTLRSFFKK